MPIIAGVDGCPGGWICITLDTLTGITKSTLFPSAMDLFQQSPQPNLLLIDIPIGLTAAHGRLCDAAARQLLGTRHVCVFPAPIRPALSAQNRVQASQITETIDGRKVGCQSWAIYPKILEVDRILRQSPSMQHWVFEVHPELSFRQWNGAVPIAFSKKTRAGRHARQFLIGQQVFMSVRNQYGVAQVGHDDISDAFAALWTAQRKLAGVAITIPAVPPVDAMGLRMEIVY